MNWSVRYNIDHVCNVLAWLSHAAWKQSAYLTVDFISLQVHRFWTKNEWQQCQYNMKIEFSSILGSLNNCSGVQSSKRTMHIHNIYLLWVCWLMKIAELSYSETTYVMHNIEHISQWFNIIIMWTSTKERHTLVLFPLGCHGQPQHWLHSADSWQLGLAPAKRAH